MYMVAGLLPTVGGPGLEPEVAGRFLLQAAPGFVETHTSLESSLETV